MCEYCEKTFNTREAKSLHKKKCKIDIEFDKDKIKLDILKEENKKLELLKKDNNIEMLNNQLINIIVDKSRKI